MYNMLLHYTYRVAQTLSVIQEKFTSVSLLSKDFRSVFNVTADNLNIYYDNVTLHD